MKRTGKYLKYMCYKCGDTVLYRYWDFEKHKKSLLNHYF